jgi:hypothetical protein
LWGIRPMRLTDMAVDDSRERGGQVSAAPDPCFGPWVPCHWA